MDFSQDMIHLFLCIFLQRDCVRRTSDFLKELISGAAIKVTELVEFTELWMLSNRKWTLTQRMKEVEQESFVGCAGLFCAPTEEDEKDEPSHEPWKKTVTVEVYTIKKCPECEKYKDLVFEVESLFEEIRRIKEKIAKKTGLKINSEVEKHVIFC